MIKGKKIVMTGVTGRVGGNFAERLAKDNEVWAMARFSKPGEREYFEKAGVHTVVGDYVSGDFTGLPEEMDYGIHVAASVYPSSMVDGMRANAEGAGLFMYHCRKAEKFLHVSTTGVYAHNDDVHHVYTIEDPVGGDTMGHYTGTKTAGEGAVRALCRILKLPTIICRLDVQYGTYTDGGLIGNHFKCVLHGMDVRLPKKYPIIHRPVHDDDLFDFIEPCLNAASLDIPIVNWCGDDIVTAEEWINYCADLVGLKATIKYTDEISLPTCIPSNAERLKVTGPCKVFWKDGLKRCVQVWEKKFK